ncbi:hypothetical protein HG15A2_32030 [Adhaeretor mobilis]|uniref:Uncharacterized protein n=1 Tax=Adhaeretor mobilis TaxID=1930276 RepID=A0A517MYB3_9BACT|nr:hypothetical protein HG15A2_32030 [Adhaeretor mobilis]
MLSYALFCIFAVCFSIQLVCGSTYEIEKGEIRELTRAESPAKYWLFIGIEGFAIAGQFMWLFLM